MRWKRLSSLPLSRQLLWLLVPALLLISLAELRSTAAEVHRAADSAYDRSLLGALKAIDANVSTESGGLSVELPYRLVGSSRVDLQACKLEYSIVSPK